MINILTYNHGNCVHVQDQLEYVINGLKSADCNASHEFINYCHANELFIDQCTHMVRDNTPFPVNRFYDYRNSKALDYTRIFKELNNFLYR